MCRVRCGAHDGADDERRATSPAGGGVDAAASETPTVRGQMLLSLRAAVGSRALHGDCLSAAVHAIQRAAAEENAHHEGQTGEKEGVDWMTSWQLLPTFLPVSGTALLAAAERRARGVNGGEPGAGAGKDDHSNPETTASSSTYYTVLPHGLQYAKKFSMTRTFRSRAAFTEPNDDDNDTDANARVPDAQSGLSAEGDKATGAVSVAAPLYRPPKLRFNTAHADMAYYVYKRFLPRDDVQCKCEGEAGPTKTDDASSTKGCKENDELSMDAVLQREGERIARVPMPVVEWHYPK